MKEDPGNITGKDYTTLVRGSANYRKLQDGDIVQIYVRNEKNFVNKEGALSQGIERKIVRFDKSKDGWIDLHNPEKFYYPVSDVYTLLKTAVVNKRKKRKKKRRENSNHIYSGSLRNKSGLAAAKQLRLKLIF